MDCLKNERMSCLKSSSTHLYTNQLTSFTHAPIRHLFYTKTPISLTPPPPIHTLPHSPPFYPPPPLHPIHIIVENVHEGGVDIKRGGESVDVVGKMGVDRWEASLKLFVLGQPDSSVKMKLYITN